MKTLWGISTVGRTKQSYFTPKHSSVDAHPLAKAGENFSASLICPRQIRSADRHLKMPPGSRLSPTLSFMEFRPPNKFEGATSKHKKERERFHTTTREEHNRGIPAAAVKSQKDFGNFITGH